jgi:protein AFG1
MPDEIFFPDAAKALSAQEKGEDNPLAQDMIGEVMQDLEAPFRPNISSYSSTSVKDSLEAAAIKQAQTTSPAFRNLSIFTGQDEQFAYRRALSRIFELTSKEFIQTAVHNPLPAEARVWEHKAPVLRPVRRGAITSSDSTDDLGATGASDLSASIASRRDDLEPSDSVIPRGTKVNPLTLDVDTADLPKPKISSNHIWGIIDTWGKKAGRWGQGVEAKKLERKNRLDMMREEERK